MSPGFLAISFSIEIKKIILDLYEEVEDCILNVFRVTADNAPTFH